MTLDNDLREVLDALDERRRLADLCRLAEAMVGEPIAGGGVGEAVLFEPDGSEQAWVLGYVEEVR